MTTVEVFRVDDMRPVLAVIREKGVRVDPLFADACRQLFGNVGTRLRYCRKAGRTRVAQPSNLAIERAAAKARSTRLRKFECPDCHQIARGTRGSILICGLCFEMNNEITHMVRVDPLPEEILERAA